jgi:hypothetical protein
VDSLALIDSLIQQLDGLPVGDDPALDALRQRADMIVRKLMGDQSPYLQRLETVRFWPLMGGGDDDYSREAWNYGAAQFRNALLALREELVLFSSADHTPGTGSIGPSDVYVAPERIDALKAAKSGHFDLAKVIAICEELNKCYAGQCYLATAALVRMLVDHVPPVFGFDTFAQVVAQRGGRSVKRSLEHLDKSLRPIADHHLHQPIGRKEILPTRTQVDFRSDLDVLLAEVIGLL